MSVPLLATKTYLPIPQAQWIDRARLVARLNDGLSNHHRLILVSASAGAGKSSLLAEWAAVVADANAPRTVVWVSLDAEDNDPIRFWTYCLAAIQTRFPGEMQALIDALGSPQPPAILPFLNEVVNQLASLAVEHLVLVLDDYHLIEAQAVHESLSYFLDHIPPNIHLVIATRSDPPLPLHRWRGRGQLTEIRFADLRFTLAETQLYLTERMRLDLNPEDISQLEQRTEGWIVGLHLAALLMKGRSDASAFIARFSSNNHYILEYLTNEVLDRLPENEQDFLLQISILPQFNPALCDAVTGRSDSQALLDRFWKANLFLIPLDDDHFWYRYHHLFADLLGQKLKQKGETNLRALNQRAADWYAAGGMIDDAIRCALAARNFSMAAELVVKNRRQSMNAGNFKRFFGWMTQIPPDILAGDARYSLVYAVLLYNNGQAAHVAEHLDNAQQAYMRLAQAGKIPLGDPDYATLPGLIAAFRAMLALRLWDLPGAVHYAEETLRVSLPEDHHSRGMAGIALAQAQSELGMWEKAILTYRQTIPTCEASGNRIGAAVCYHQLATLLQIQGRLQEAQATLEAALEQAGYEHLEELPAAGVLWVGLAEMNYEMNQLAQAQERLEKGYPLVRQGGFLDIQKPAAILQANLSGAAGRMPEAAQEIKSAYDFLHQASLDLALPELKAYRALYAANLGRLDEAAAWADAQDAQVSDPPGLTRGIDLYCLARVWIRLGKWEAAWNLLTQLEKYAGEGKSLRRQAEAQLLLALIAYQQNHRSESFTLLEKAILFGVKQGYLRLFLDEGERLRALLQEYYNVGRPDRSITPLVVELLAGFPKYNRSDETGDPGKSPEPNSTPQSASLDPTRQLAQPATKPLIEPLSERELEVLGLMSEGLTNPKIADRLTLSLSTIKTHLNNIYGKLNVRNRAEAVLRAKELGLL